MSLAVVAAVAAVVAVANPPLDAHIAIEQEEMDARARRESRREEESARQVVERARQVDQKHKTDAGLPNHSQVERVIAALERIALALEGGGA
jgi:hypothetical protein